MSNHKKRLTIGASVRITGADESKTDLTGKTGYILHHSSYEEHLPTCAVVVVGATQTPRGRVGGHRHEVRLDRLEAV